MMNLTYLEREAEDGSLIELAAQLSADGDLIAIYYLQDSHWIPLPDDLAATLDFDELAKEARSAAAAAARGWP